MQLANRLQFGLIFKLVCPLRATGPVIGAEQTRERREDGKQKDESHEWMSGEIETINNENETGDGHDDQ